MKKSLFLAIFLMPVLVLANNTEDQTLIETATLSTTTPPVVSIGIGNGNVPENLGPVHNNVYHGDISVFATVTDNDIESYHFRVIEDGGSEGHTCTEELGLFAEGNQGYASTTLSKFACGFNYNKSLFISEGFTNSLLTIVNTLDLGAFSGEGDYWFVLGAKDLEQNRTHLDYTQDPRVKVTIDNTPPVTIGEVLVSGIEGPFNIKTTATDAYGVASTTIYSSSSDGINCGSFTQAIGISGSMSTTSAMSVQWTPEVSGVYCIGVSSQDVPGNIETIKTLATEIHFISPVVVTPPTPPSSPSPSPSPTPTPTPSPESTVGNGSPSSFGGGNGPIVNTFGVVGSGSITNPIIPNQNGGNGLGPIFPGGIGGDGTEFDNQTRVGSNVGSEVLAKNNSKSKNIAGISIASAEGSDETSSGTTTLEVSTSTGQLALAGFSGADLNWLWLLVLALLIGGGYYIYKKK